MGMGRAKRAGVPVKCLVAATMGGALLSGCVTAREQEQTVKPEVVRDYLADKPGELHRHFYVSLTQGQRNRVLNDMRLGLAAYSLGQTELSTRLFDDALQGIEAVYANNENAKAARQLFVKEAVKDFKGEPYERVMAYYYRGLLYMGAGDYENARASFKGGMLQDAFAEEEQNRADFSLMPYLQGWSARCAGNPSLAAEDFKEFRDVNKDTPLPGDKDNVLVLVEAGTAPVKFSAGDANSAKPRYLKLLRASPTETARVSWVDLIPAPPAPPVKNAKKGAPPPAAIAPTQVPRTMDAPLVEDIFHQAVTRGGREFDSVLNGKAQFKSGANTVGNVALAGAGAAAMIAMTSGNSAIQQNAGAAGAALLLVGLMAKAAAEAAEPDADTRYWDNLPDRVYGLPLTLNDGVNTVLVEFLAPDGTTVRTSEVAIKRAGRCGLAWVHGAPAVPPNPRAPYSAPPEQMARPVILPSAAPPAGIPVTAVSSPNGEKKE